MTLKVHRKQTSGHGRGGIILFGENFDVILDALDEDNDMEKQFMEAIVEVFEVR